MFVGSFCLDAEQTRAPRATMRLPKAGSLFKGVREHVPRENFDIQGANEAILRPSGDILDDISAPTFPFWFFKFESVLQ